MSHIKLSIPVYRFPSVSLISFFPVVLMNQFKCDIIVEVIYSYFKRKCFQLLIAGGVVLKRSCFECHHPWETQHAMKTPPFYSSVVKTLLEKQMMQLSQQLTFGEASDKDSGEVKDESPRLRPIFAKKHAIYM